MTDASSPPEPIEPSGIAGLPDQVLVAAARTGNRDAFGTLWERHAAAGRRFAAATTRAFDADDLVAEAYVKIYTAVLAGKGPTGPFRPYLLVTIRNLAISWAKQRRDGPLEDADDVPDPRATDMAVLAEVDANLTVRAFRTLPERWQEVLWFTEVDGLPSADVAERLGMTVSGVGMLALRAREGLRQAWIQAHIDTSALGSEHQWALQQIGQNARGKLRMRAKAKFDAHLAGCAACTVIAAEAVETSNHFTPALVPLAVGVLGATSLGAFLHSAPPAAAATAHARDGAATGSRAAVGRRGRVFLVAGAVALVAVTGAAIGNAAIRTPATSPSALAPTGATSGPRPSTSSATAAPSNAPTVIPGPASSTSAAAPTATPGTETKRTPPVTTPSDSAAAPSDAASPAASVMLPTITSADTAGGVLYPRVTGTARPGTSVTVSAETGNSVTVTTDAGGTWRVPELRIGAGSASITASGDDGSSEPETVRVESPQVFASVARTTVRITIIGAADTRYAVEWDGVAAGTVRTDTDGRATVTLQNTAPDNPHTVTVHAAIGGRVGPATTVQLAARS